MSPEQFETFLADNRKSTAEAIELTVNGKIRKIHELLERQNEASHLFQDQVDTHITRADVHMTKVEPYILGAESATRVGKFIGKSLMITGTFVLTVGGAVVFLISKFK